MNRNKLYLFILVLILIVITPCTLFAQSVKNKFYVSDVTGDDDKALGSQNFLILEFGDSNVVLYVLYYGHSEYARSLMTIGGLQHNTPSEVLKGKYSQKGTTVTIEWDGGDNDVFTADRTSITDENSGLTLMQSSGKNSSQFPKGLLKAN